MVARDTWERERRQTLSECQNMGPMINHSCCVKHVNCEYVSTDIDEDGEQTVMVRTTRDVLMGEEFLAHFGEQFPTVLSTGCECCACRRATTECRHALCRGTPGKQ
jgi:SET domain-containing protein